MVEESPYVLKKFEYIQDAYLIYLLTVLNNYFRSVLAKKNIVSIDTSKISIHYSVWYTTTALYTWC